MPPSLSFSICTEGSVERVDVRPVLTLVDAARRARDPVFVGIGGHGGAGKTTLAHALPGAQIVSTDSFWDGAAFDLGRLRAEALEPLLAGRAACFAVWDWAAQAPGGVQTVEPRDVIVVEGVCALHRLLRDAYDVRVWVDAPEALRLERGVARDGEAARRTWVEQWLPSEERYVERDRPVDAAHVLVDGSGPPPPPWSPRGGATPGSAAGR
jgi:uridine kinase